MSSSPLVDRPDNRTAADRAVERELERAGRRRVPFGPPLQPQCASGRWERLGLRIATPRPGAHSAPLDDAPR